MLINWVDKIQSAAKDNGFRIVETEANIQLFFEFSVEAKNSCLAIIRSKPNNVISHVCLHSSEIGEDLPGLNLDEEILNNGDQCSLLLIKNKDVPLFFITLDGFVSSLEKITKSRVVFL
ncbi:hypothetical protein [Deefgea sp. CFH1-16]|uniref:hypothetical protein n=1 Tax=Deefgea sp. CFH1-16 TaxID=2675457 RepID=UPI0015F3906B|nr:hypothetical protein [Deefgea sp. CFH1-16]MBM5575245.1 hypothetical protein [Deefgea sp. CFH1-16]